MLSIIVAVKDCRKWVSGCLESLLHSLRILNLGTRAELIVIDDNSRPDSDIPGLIRSIRNQVPVPIRGIRFRRHQHYTYSVALGLSLARGEQVLFVSHDMIVPPACLSTLLGHAVSHPEIGILRPVSRHMDYAPFAQIDCPFRSRGVSDVVAFGRCVAKVCAGQLIPHPYLIGDAMLVSRDVIKKIGVLDTRFFGFMGDLDYGLRAVHAGFAPAIARDAWLHHGGEAARRENVELHGPEPADVGTPHIDRAYKAFRNKWGETLPPTFAELTLDALNVLAKLPRTQIRFALYEPPLGPNPAICEEI